LSTLLQVVAKISRIFRRANYFEPFGGRRHGNGRNVWHSEGHRQLDPLVCGIRQSVTGEGGVFRRCGSPSPPVRACRSIPKAKETAHTTHNQRDPYKRSSHTHNRFVVFRFLCSQLSCSAAVHNWQHSPKLCVRLNWEKLWIWF